MQALKRSLVIGYGMALLWFIGDLQEFESGSHTYYLFRYFLLGSTTSIFLSIGLTLYSKLVTPKNRKYRFIGELLISLIFLLPGLYAPSYILFILYEEPVVLKELWSLYFYGIITAAVFLLHFSRQESIKDYLELEAKTAEARYHSLKTQMQPHFLFNSLNSLAELISQDPKLAETMTEKLSDLYRLILENAKSKTCSLSSELEIARSYLEFEKLRFGDRLQFEISVPINSENLHIPSLMLQTLVENAIKHGISNLVEGGLVSIKIENSKEDWYRISISNNGTPLSSFKIGIGLSNTLARLDLLYGKRHDFRIESKSSNLTNVSFLFSGLEYA